MNQPNLRPLDSLLASLYGRINYERQVKSGSRHFKLKNMREFLRLLGNPHLQYPVIHVAGTKGKGSVTTMIGQILKTAGLKTGVYTSPHLEAINQRMAINGQPISDELLAEVLSEIEPFAKSFDQLSESKNRRPLTFFEITTAAAFLYFAKLQADAVVLEVGLGGRLDSTNVCLPSVSVITNISFDHVKQLGSTLDKIAREKAGIIKQGVPVVSGATEEPAAEVIAKIANENRSPLYLLDTNFHLDDRLSKPSSNEGNDASSNDAAQTPFNVNGVIEGKTFNLEDLQLNLLGKHQRTNAAIAVAAVQSLTEFNIADESIRHGLELAHLPGRNEILNHNPTIIVDIAHNVASVDALVSCLENLNKCKPFETRTLIFATSRDKEIEKMLGRLIDFFDQIIVTKYQNNPRGESEATLYKIGTSICHERTKLDPPSNESQTLPCATVSQQPTPMAAWNQASHHAQAGDLICVAGSAFLVAELRPVVKTHFSKRES